MVFMPVVVVLIGQFCCEVIGHQGFKIALIGQLLLNLLLLSIPLLFC